MSFRHIQFQVRGRVQGVFYRKWAATRGDELNLKGWVRNSDDGGAVEGEAVGEGGAVSSFLKELHTGPSEAKVEAVEIGKDAELSSSSDVDGLGFKTEFEVRK